VARFKVFAKNKNTKKELVLFYDNMSSILTWENGEKVFNEKVKRENSKSDWQIAQVTTPENPLGKSNKVKNLKIQLGLSCNYSCDYCSQRFVPHADETNFKYVEKFVKNIDLWLKGEPDRIEFWGGEPLVYIKTIKPLAEKLREKFPNSNFSMVTNGSLLNPELNDWLVKMKFGIGISHDGPGQPLRGPDPLEDPKMRPGIIDLIQKLSPSGKISINSMLNRENLDRGEIQAYFRKFFESIGVKDFAIGEGGIIDPYDEGGLEHSLRNREEHLGYRRLTLKQTREKRNIKFQIVNQRVQEYIYSISVERPASSLGQKCGMDEIDTLAVDLRGNVITCQNVSAAATSPNGKQHMLGHVSQLDKVKLNTSTHWSARKECVDCPVLQTCKGACMYLKGNLWDVACNNAYTDHIPFWATAIELLTGHLPYYIEHENLPEDRKNIWGDKEEKAVIPETRKIITELNNESLNIN
jgi:uncharacterized protein